MTSVQQGLVGKPVYRNSSHAPTRGQNDPQGYIQRGLAQRVNAYNPAAAQSTPKPPMTPVGPYGGVSQIGGDGQSDTRSGVAANALARTAAPSAPPAPNWSTAESKPQNAVEAAPTTVTPPAATNPTVSINAYGQLELPFQFNNAQALIEEQQKANQALLQQKATDDANRIAYAQSLRDAMTAADSQYIGSRNNAAGSGTGFTSAYAKQLDTDATEAQRNTDDINLAKAQSDTDSINNIAGIRSGFNNTLQSRAAELGYTLDAKSGTWKLKSSKSTSKSKATDAAKKAVSKSKSKSSSKTSKSSVKSVLERFR